MAPPGMSPESTPKSTGIDLSGERRFLSWWIWVVYSILIVVGIPWYWPAQYEGTLFGLPTWTLCSLAASFVASCFTAWLLMTRWPLESVENDFAVSEKNHS